MFRVPIAALRRGIHAHPTTRRREAPVARARRLVTCWLREAREGAGDVPRVLASPGGAGRWIRRTWTRHLVVLGVAVVTALALPAALDAGLPAIFPDVKVEKKILGLLPRQTTQENPLVPVAKSVLLALAWAGIACAAVTVSLRAARAVVRDLDAIARHSPSGRVGTNGRYAIERELSRGGMGVVYAATDEVLGRRVALKELPLGLARDPAFVVRFRQEARALARLTHSNIIQVYDLIDEADRLWMAIELVEGSDLASVLARHGKMNAHATAALAVQIADGLGYAHEHGVIHRDVKPSNVLLTAAGDAKIADFGIAKLTESSTHTLTGEVFGTPRYMSPEQATGSAVGPQSDIYSLGVLLFEMLTGAPPFVGEPLHVLSQHVSQQPPSFRGTAADVSAELESVVLRMLAKEPSERPRGMRQIVVELARFR